ncbi:ABC transporter substrate-binding protein [Hydrogenispora ethanolica]|nr:hypothetical protein [Hydrogenispora ethanolica]
MTTQAAAKEILYTICPVGNASYIAAHQGWLAAGLAGMGVTATRLQTLPQERWAAHFTYREPALFREGGNIPPTWAKTNGAEPVLLGLTFLDWKQYILVRVDSPIQAVEELRGKRLGIPVNPGYPPIDFWKATAERGFETALAARGVTGAEVRFLELADDYRARRTKTWSRPGERESEALLNGEVDAIFYTGTWVQTLLETGKVRAIFEISANPELIWPLSNDNPIILTVSRPLAEEAPEIVVEYVKQVLRAAEWAKTNRGAVERIFAEQTFGTPAQVAAARPADFHQKLTPELSKRGFLALESQQRFLYDHGYITQTFAVEKWADDRFLKEARQALDSILESAI